MILMIDNYDSFTYNLVQLFQQQGEQVTVVANDAVSVADIDALSPAAIILSPGPGTPAESGICPEVVRAFHGRLPILGVCLGHQVIGEVFGAVVSGASRIMHGKTDTIRHVEDPFFQDMPETFTAARYHSLAVDALDQAPDLRCIARSESDGTVMAMRHIRFPVYGVQFHPESFATEWGASMARNFIQHFKIPRTAKGGDPC